MDKPAIPARLAAVDFTERSLRDLLISPYGKNCGESLLEKVERGQSVTIQMQDESTLTLSDRPTAELMLWEFFRWKLE